MGNLMSENALVLNVSDDLYEDMRKIAEESNRPVEELALESLQLLFAQNAPLPKLEELNDYTDTNLWAVVHRRLNWTQSLRLRELIAKTKDDSITQDERTELELLIDLNDEFMVLRSQALLLLKQRGHDISDYLSISDT